MVSQTLPTAIAPRVWRALLFASTVLAVAAGPSVVSAEGESFVEDPAAKKYALILVGAAVDEENANEFGGWGLALRNSLQDDFGYTPRRVRLLVGSADHNDFNVDGPCRTETIRDAFETLALQVEPGDQLSIFLIGHGTGSGETAKFAVVGPDITGVEFGELLNTINTQNIVVVNTTSASHDFSRPLAAKGRVIVSATRSRAEKYDTVFPRYFIEGLQQHAADRDKNRRVSVLEAFNYAKAQVDNYFSEQGILATEHATLDDSGDSVFSTKPEGRGDGRLAEIAYLDVSGAEATNLSPAAAELRSRMSNLEREVFLLRANKSSLSESEYWAQLEPLLIELSKVTREFDGVSKP